MGDSDFIGHCPTNAGCPISSFYCCENMDGWEKFNEISLPKKEGLYSHLKVTSVAKLFLSIKYHLICSQLFSFEKKTMFCSWDIYIFVFSWNP